MNIHEEEEKKKKKERDNELSVVLYNISFFLTLLDASCRYSRYSMLILQKMHFLQRTNNLIYI